MNQPNKLDCSTTQLEMLTGDEHSNLLGKFLSYEENKVLWIWTLEPALGLFFAYRGQYAENLSRA